MIIAALIWTYLIGAGVSWFFCREVISPKPDWQDYTIIATWCVSIPAIFAWVLFESATGRRL